MGDRSAERKEAGDEANDSYGDRDASDGLRTHPSTSGPSIR